MIVWRLLHNLNSFSNACVSGLSSLLTDVLNPAARPLKQQRLTITVNKRSRLSLIAFDLVPVHLHFRHIIASIIITQVAWRINEHCPRCHPQPKPLLFVRVQLQVSGLLTVSLKEPRHRLPAVHHTEKVGVVNQFDELIR